jgi:N-carbamoylputrescine amidase
METLRVAAAQLISRPGEIEANLERAREAIGRAAEEEAELVLLPELLPSGYSLTESLWDAAEPPEGPTVTWLRRESSRHGLYVGTTFLEVRGDDFFDTFVLADGTGDVVLRTRKSRPASVESFVFRGARDARVVATPLGRIGVAICYEAMLAEVVRSLHAGGADLVLLPYCAPTPNIAPGFGAAELEAFHATIAQGGRAITATLGVPTVIANQSGPWTTAMPIFGDADSKFPGLSSITDCDGTVLASLDDAEGVITADVTLDPARKLQEPPAARGRWARPLPWFVHVWAASEIVGGAAYRLSAQRRARARAVMDRK